MADSPGSAFLEGIDFFDADEGVPPGGKLLAAGQVHVRRTSTLFPQAKPSRQLGPWRATEVEQRDSETWLLLGRRHSVDERRDAMTQGKMLFLQLLASLADGPWRECTAERAEALQALEDSTLQGLDQQQRALRASRDFWASRSASDRAYLETLASCATAAGGASLGASRSQREARWRSDVQLATETSEAWARQLPEVLRVHEEAAAEVRRRVVHAMAEPVAHSRTVSAARMEVWPAAAAQGGLRQATGTHDSDLGPDGSCLWRAVRRYVVACEALRGSQAVALARVRRQERRSQRLGDWVERTLGRSDLSSGGLTPSPLSPASSGGAQTPSVADEVTPVSFQGGTETGDSDEGPLEYAVDLSPLVVHERVVEIQEEGSWVPARVLMSVDLWLHVWAGDAMKEFDPSMSIHLPRACLRPVAKRGPEDPRVLTFAFRPPETPSLWQTVSQLLNHEVQVPVKQLALRCEDAAGCEELLSDLELVEKLYPLVQ